MGVPTSEHGGDRVSRISLLRQTDYFGLGLRQNLGPCGRIMEERLFPNAVEVHAVALLGVSLARLKGCLQMKILSMDTPAMNRIAVVVFALTVLASGRLMLTAQETAKPAVFTLAQAEAGR